MQSVVHRARSPKKRGTDARRLALLSRLRPVLRAAEAPDKLLRSVTTLLAVEIGQYCIVDIVDSRGAIRRLEIGHADPSRRAALRIACEDASPDTSRRVARLLASTGSELVPRVSEGRARALDDLALLPGEAVRSYMAASIAASGRPLAVLTLAVTKGARRYDEDELGFLVAVAEWTGLALENALLREGRANGTRGGELPRNAPGGREEARASAAAVARKDARKEKMGSATVSSLKGTVRSRKAR